jgi:hypothetical protein
MILTGEHLAVIILTNSRLHETGEGRKHIDWWVDLAIVQVSVNEDLTFSNVPGQIWDGMGNIVVRHGKNGQLGDGTVGASDTTSSLVDG